MKKLFKTIFILLIVLVLFVGGTLLTLYLVVSDNTDNAPTDLYTSEVSVEGEIDDLFSRFFVNHDDAFYLAFTEDDLNRLLFAFLKNANANYYSGCESDECQYFLTQEIPSSVPIIGGDKLYIKHAYAEITDNGLNFYLTLKTPYFNTNLNLGFDFEEEEGTYILTLNKLGLGGMNLMTSLGKKISGPMLDALGMGEDSINQMILENGLPLEFKLEDYSFRFEKEDLGEMVISLLGDDEGVENTLLNDFVNLLSSSENDLLNFGFFELDDEKQFGFQIDLNEIKTTIAISEALETRRSQAAIGFDADSFIANKTQTFIISNLSSDGKHKFVFTNQDFDRIIYDKTNGYEMFKYSLREGEESNFEVTGIFIDFNVVTTTFNFVIKINGVEVLIQIIGDVHSPVDGSQLNIALREQMSFGGIMASGAFIFEILENIGDLEALAYNPANKTFTISTETFNSFMAVGGPTTPLSVDEIRAVNGGIEVFVEIVDSELLSIISSAQDAIEDLLATDFLDETAFNVDDPDQAELVDELVDALDNIADILQDPEGTLSSEDTDELTDLINSLSDDNQQILLDQITDGANSSDLEELYDQLFGN